ncbi:VWA domain-containing protein [Roseibium salinum]|nr:VWA domain-containing protein [Roseibium salinum]
MKRTVFFAVVTVAGLFWVAMPMPLTTSWWCSTDRTRCGGQIDGIAKIEIARDAMESLMGDWTAQTNLGLMAYGHRREADCSDIETIIPPGRVDPSEFLSRVRQITPRGKTPLSAAIEKAADELAFRDNPATVVVISDGIESCERDPCALANDLERAGIGFTAHVIGFGLDSEEEQESLACIAEQTGRPFHCRV